jgi:hypothetical protein
MAYPSSFERDFEHLRRLLSDAFKGMDAAEAASLHHAKSDARLTAINFPLEEGLLGETISLLTAWKSLAAKLLRDMDTAAAAEKLSFDRLFDRQAGLETAGWLKRRAPVGKVAPEAIAMAMMSRLAVMVPFETMLKDAKPVLVRHHRQCEYYLLQIVERRRHADGAIDEVSHLITEMKARLHAHQVSASSARTPSALAASEQERKSIRDELLAAQGREETLGPERETLMRLIDDVGGFVDALNSQIAATNAMATKLSVDIEQSIALMKAAEAQSAPPMVSSSDAVSEAIVAFDANPFSGYGLFERKQTADAAFARRLDAVLPAAEEPLENSADEGNPVADEQLPVEIRQ